MSRRNLNGDARTCSTTIHKSVDLRFVHCLENDTTTQTVYGTHKGAEVFLARSNLWVALHDSDKASCENGSADGKASFDEVAPEICLTKHYREGRKVTAGCGKTCNVSIPPQTGYRVVVATTAKRVREEMVCNGLYSLFIVHFRT